MVDKDTLQIIKELADKIEFAEHFLKDEFPKIEKKLEVIAKTDIDKEYFENLKNEIEKNREKFLKILDEEYQLMLNTKNEIENNKKYLLNVSEKINEKIKKISRTNTIFNIVNIATAISVFFAAAIIGFSVGYGQYFWQIKDLKIEKLSKRKYRIDDVANVEKVDNDSIIIKITK